MLCIYNEIPARSDPVQRRGEYSIYKCTTPRARRGYLTFRFFPDARENRHALLAHALAPLPDRFRVSLARRLGLPTCSHIPLFKLIARALAAHTPLATHAPPPPPVSQRENAASPGPASSHGRRGHCAERRGDGSTSGRRRQSWPPASHLRPSRRPLPRPPST